MQYVKWNCWWLHVSRMSMVCSAYAWCWWKCNMLMRVYCWMLRTEQKPHVYMGMCVLLQVQAVPCDAPFFRWWITNTTKNRGKISINCGTHYCGTSEFTELQWEMNAARGNFQALETASCCCLHSAEAWSGRSIALQNASVCVQPTATTFVLDFILLAETTCGWSSQTEGSERFLFLLHRKLRETKKWKFLFRNVMVLNADAGRVFRQTFRRLMFDMYGSQLNRFLLALHGPRLHARLTLVLSLLLFSYFYRCCDFIFCPCPACFVLPWLQAFLGSFPKSGSEIKKPYPRHDLWDRLIVTQTRLVAVIIFLVFAQTMYTRTETS